MKNLHKKLGVSSRLSRGFIAPERGFIALSRGLIALTICKPAWILALHGKTRPLPSFYLFFTSHALWIKARQSHNQNLDCAFGAQGWTRPSLLNHHPPTRLRRAVNRQGRVLRRDLTIRRCLRFARCVVASRRSDSNRLASVVLHRPVWLAGGNDFQLALFTPFSFSKCKGIYELDF